MVSVVNSSCLRSGIASDQVLIRANRSESLITLTKEVGLVLLVIANKLRIPNGALTFVPWSNVTRWPFSQYLDRLHCLQVLLLNRSDSMSRSHLMDLIYRLPGRFFHGKR